MRAREAVLLASLVLVGCDYREEKVAGEVATITRPVAYSEVRAKVLGPSCVECHRTQNPPLETYAVAAKAAHGIRSSVFEKKTMPKRGSLTPEQKAILLAWLDQGSPEGEPVAESSPEPSAGPVRVTWAEVKMKVLDVACNSCHFPGNEQQLSDLTSLEFTRATIGSSVGLALSNLMPPPENSRPLSDEQKRLLTEWWIAGLPEN